jgi:hypothetical protein
MPIFKINKYYFLDLLQTAILLLRIDDIVSGSKKKGEQQETKAAPSEASMQE